VVGVVASVVFKLLNPHKLMASMSRQLDDDDGMSILYESDEYLVCNSSDTDSDIEDDIAMVDAAVDEMDSDSEERSLGDTDFNSEFIWEGMEKKHYHREGAWCVPNTAERNTHYIAAYSVTSACVWRIVLKPITQNFISSSYREQCSFVG
jgi:hypothetical protein